MDLTDRDRVRTTIDLERDRNGDGVAEWTATQYEVPVVGWGATAPEAAANYCRRIAAGGSREASDAR